MDWQDEFKSKLSQVTILLQEAEKILKENGINTPCHNISLKPQEKIAFPRNYIRTVAYFLEAYRLHEIIIDPKAARNIAYALQTSDLFNYFINRVRIDLSVGKIFLKHAMINGFSIIEGILYATNQNLHDYCCYFGEVCRKNCGCGYYLKASSKYKFKELISIFTEKNIMFFDEQELALLMQLKTFRDNIHLHIVEENEYKADFYNLSNYNLTISMLMRIRDGLPSAIDKYQRVRLDYCKR